MNFENLIKTMDFFPREKCRCPHKDTVFRDPGPRVTKPYVVGSSIKS